MLEAELRSVRAIVLGADPRVEECIKWKTPTFTSTATSRASTYRKKFVSLMFHRGSEIPGEHPRLDGTGDLVRVMRFGDLAEIEAAEPELVAVIQAWCAWKEA